MKKTLHAICAVIFLVGLVPVEETFAKGGIGRAVGSAAGQVVGKAIAKGMKESSHTNSGQEEPEGSNDYERSQTKSVTNYSYAPQPGMVSLNRTPNSTSATGNYNDKNYYIDPMKKNVRPASSKVMSASKTKTSTKSSSSGYKSIYSHSQNSQPMTYVIERNPKTTP